MATNTSLYVEYQSEALTFARLKNVMVEQAEHLVLQAGLTLGVPLESRVKSWDSIAKKLERKQINPESLNGLDDLVGIRAIFLFQRDLEPFQNALSSAFDVLTVEDTANRLADTQFGYQSRHYIIRTPESWKAIPSLQALTGQMVEIQVRTLAQHIWAAASHKLQYKNEDSVPLPLRRSTYRVSALLETVDLEFSRILDDRDKYQRQQLANAAASDPINVTVLEAVLDEVLPSKSKDNDAEEYSEFIEDLQHFDITTRGKLRSLLQDNLTTILRKDQEEVRNRLEEGEFSHDDDVLPGESVLSRLNRGVFFTHVGLARQALCEHFGENVVRDWLGQRM